MRINWEAVGAIAGVLALTAYLYAERSKFSTPARIFMGGFAAFLLYGFLAVLLSLIPAIVDTESTSEALEIGVRLGLLFGIPAAIGGMTGSRKRGQRIGAILFGCGGAILYLLIFITNERWTFLNFIGLYFPLVAFTSIFGGIFGGLGGRVAERIRRAERTPRPDGSRTVAH